MEVFFTKVQPKFSEVGAKESGKSERLIKIKLCYMYPIAESHPM